MSRRLLPLTAALLAVALLNGYAIWCACRAPLYLPEASGAGKADGYLHTAMDHSGH